MRHFIAVTLAIAGLVHLLPLAGVLGAPSLQQLYGIPVAEPNLEILLRHRAVLFGLLGALLLAAAWRSDWQAVGFAAGLASVVAYIVLVFVVGGANPALMRVLWIDVGVALLLAAGAVARLAHAR